jgi:DNA-binding phage protein
MPSVSYDALISEMFAGDPVAAVETLQSTLEEGEAAEFLIVHGQLKQAFGSAVELEEAGAEEMIQAYRRGLKKGEPSILLLIQTMKKLGLKLMVVPENANTAIEEQETAA